MSKKEDANYAEWLAEIKAKHPDIAPKLDEIAETEAGREIFRGGLREADYYRRLNEVRDDRDALAREKAEIEAEGDRQVSWWKQAKPEYDEAVEKARRLEALEAKMKEFGMTPDASLPPAPAAPSKEIEDLKQRMRMMDEGYPRFMLGLFQAQSIAIRDGLPFDPDAVIQKVYKDKVDPVTAFNELSRPQREEKAKTLLQHELEKAKEEGRREALSKLSGPDRAVRPAGPSIVDALTGQAQVLTNERERRDAAVKDWMELDAQGQV